MKSHNFLKLNVETWRKLRNFQKNWKIKSKFRQNTCPTMRHFNKFLYFFLFHDKILSSSSIRSSVFYYLMDMNIYTLNLLVCNSGQYTYVTALCNIFFVLEDLIDRIDSYFQRIAFQRNLLLIASNTLCHEYFSMEVTSLHWNGAV